MLAHQSLSLRQSLLQSCNSQLIVFDAQNDRVAGLYVKSTPKRSGDNNPPVFVNASMTLYRRHDILYVMSFCKSVSSDQRSTRLQGISFVEITHFSWPVSNCAA